MKEAKWFVCVLGRGEQEAIAWFVDKDDALEFCSNKEYETGYSWDVGEIL